VHNYEKGATMNDDALFWITFTAIIALVVLMIALLA
jgi:hypothetical protein